MNDRPTNGNRSSPRNWLLAASVFVAAAGAGFLILFGFFVPVRSTPGGWQVVFSLAFVIVGATIVGAVLGRRRNKSTVVPALITLVCAVLLTVGAGFGYLATCNYEGRPDPSNGTFFALAFAGAIFCAISVIWLFIAIIVAIIVRFFRKDPDQDRK